MEAKIDVTLTAKGDVARKKARKILLKAVQSKMRLTKQYEDGRSSFWWMSIIRSCPAGTNFEHHYITKWNARNDHNAIISGDENELRIQFQTPGDAVPLLQYAETIAFTVTGTLLDTWGTPFQWCGDEGWLSIKENNDGSNTESKQSNHKISL
jgi:hypothetical protein